MSAKKENGELSEQIARAAAERIAAYEQKHYGPISPGFPGPSKEAETRAITAIIEAALAESAKERGWPDIATAPKDGTKIVVAEFDGERWRFAVDYWRKYNPICGGEGFGAFGMVPTHWMPLPPPPAEEQPNG
jgi:hypothetical protein